MGDRTVQGITTLIANEEWQLDTDYHRGSIGDVIVFRNTNVHAKGVEPNWEWYAAIPTANIKAYRLAGELPGLTDGESQTQNPPSRSASASAK
jgi:hypothetical protein